MEPLPASANPGWPLPFVPQDWEHTPAAVHAYMHNLQDELTQRRVRVTTPSAKADGFVRNACVHNHYVNPNRLSPSHDIR
jgi:hypothetical protein